ncbi:hypothetical protein [Burkholderia cenocepacia]|uniref:hypothetical protein n=1 Tax=Burkholderia cenocepacia TaxID=95486 RepID=UPI002AB16BD2|nr:hypothetical protein [Burkholderia cenocepacia]
MLLEQPHRIVGIACLNVDHAAVILAQQRCHAVAQNRMIIDNEYFHVNKNKVAGRTSSALGEPGFSESLNTLVVFDFVWPWPNVGFTSGNARSTLGCRGFRCASTHNDDRDRRSPGAWREPRISGRD